MRWTSFAPSLLGSVHEIEGTGDTAEQNDQPNEYESHGDESLVPDTVG